MHEYFTLSYRTVPSVLSFNILSQTFSYFLLYLIYMTSILDKYSIAYSADWFVELGACIVSGCKEGVFLWLWAFLRGH